MKGQYDRPYTTRTITTLALSLFFDNEPDRLKQNIKLLQGFIINSVKDDKV